MKIIDHSSGIRVPNYSKSTINWQIDVIIGCTTSSSNDVVFFLSSLVTGPSFMSISLLVLELRNFLFKRDLTGNLEIGNIPLSEFFCGGLGIPNLP